MRKRFPALTLLLTLLLCVTVRAAETRLEVHLPAGPVEAGEEFTVTVDLTGNPGVRTIQFTLAFDRNRMECIDANIGEWLSQQEIISAANPAAQSGAILAAASADVITGDGQVGIYRFRANEKLSDFHFSIDKITLTDRDKNKLDVVVTDAEASNGSVSADSGATSNGSGSTDNGSTPSGSKPADNDKTSVGGNATDSGKTSNGSGSTDSGKTSNGSGSTDSGKTSGGSNATDSGKTSGGSATPESATPPFTDIEGTWAESYIRTAAARNLVQGYSDGAFRPDSRLTRAQFMMVLWNLAGRPEPTKESPFSDMAAQIENFRKAVSWAYEKGYVSGATPETFAPGEPITRQAAVKILFAYNGSRRGPEALLTSVYDEQYADSGRISSWARNAIYWAVYQTILSGTSPTTLDPGGTVTRAQLAAIMVRYTDRFPAS